MRPLAGEPGDDTQVRFEQSRTRRVSEPARCATAPASRTGSSRTFPRSGHHHAQSWCASRSPAFRHEPGIVHACGCHAARGLRGRWSLVGRMFNPTEQQWLLGTGSSPDRPCSRGAPRPITPDTTRRARSEPFSRHTAPRVADGPRHRPMRSWHPWLGSAAKQAKPEARPRKVRHTSQQAPRPEPRSIGEHSVYIGTPAERRVLHA
jgi:hypothetical protein